jgi:hypothetical protein
MKLTTVLVVFVICCAWLRDPRHTLCICYKPCFFVSDSRSASQQVPAVCSIDNSQFEESFFGFPCLPQTSLWWLNELNTWCPWFHPNKNVNLFWRVVTLDVGRAIAQAVSRSFPTAAVRVRARVRPCGIFGGRSGTRADFLRVLRFPLPIFILPIAPQSPSLSPGAGTIGQ